MREIYKYTNLSSYSKQLYSTVKECFNCFSSEAFSRRSFRHRCIVSWAVNKSTPKYDRQSLCWPNLWSRRNVSFLLEYETSQKHATCRKRKNLLTVFLRNSFRPFRKNYSWFKLEEIETTEMAVCSFFFYDGASHLLGQLTDSTLLDYINSPAELQSVAWTSQQSFNWITIWKWTEMTKNSKFEEANRVSCIL